MVLATALAGAAFAQNQDGMVLWATLGGCGRAFPSNPGARIPAAMFLCPRWRAGLCDITRQRRSPTDVHHVPAGIACTSRVISRAGPGCAACPARRKTRSPYRRRLPGGCALRPRLAPCHRSLLWSPRFLSSGTGFYALAVGRPLRRMPSQGACDLGVWCPLRHPPGSAARKASFRRLNVTTMPLTREFAVRQPRPK